MTTLAGAGKRWLECLFGRAQLADLHDKQGTFPRPRQSATVHYLPRGEVEDLVDLEFSDHGRDPRFLPGWWILPALLLAPPVLIWIASLLV